jgi:hypothetical protein
MILQIWKWYEMVMLEVHAGFSNCLKIYDTCLQQILSAPQVALNTLTTWALGFLVSLGVPLALAGQSSLSF